jgi:tungstate transport system ATP-binding protein
LLPLLLEDVSFVAGGRTIIAGVSCELAAGPRTVILGPNGAGKSVLMRLCHGLLAPTSGRIVWQGGGDERRPRAQAMVFQRPVMLRRSALHNVTYGLSLAGVARAVRERRAREVLARVGLDAAAGRPARVLSGGEQQKLALARAWALEPEVLFLDEPTANLDPGATREVERIVEQIHSSGTKIVMTTHDLGQARRLADEILFMSGGRLTERASVEPFFAQPATAAAAAFIKGELPWS